MLTQLATRWLRWVRATGRDCLPGRQGSRQGCGGVRPKARQRKRSSSPHTSTSRSSWLLKENYKEFNPTNHVVLRRLQNGGAAFSRSYTNTQKVSHVVFRVLAHEPFNETQVAGVLPDAPYLLEVEGVRKEFPGVVALDGVRLQIRPGTVHALMGENGAGKSTLMKIIAGVYQPDTGEIRLKGKPVKLTTPLAALDAGIAMIHQELNLMPYMTVAENVWIRREPMKGLGFMDFVDHAEMRRMTEHLFRRLNIDLDPEIEVRYLTVANRQIVEIAKAVSFESDILIMDEPTSALTEREVEHLFAIIADLKAHGVGIVYITHKMDEVFEIADDVSVFRDGRYIATHRAKDINRDILIKEMVGRDLDAMFPKEIVPIGDVALSVKNLALEGVFSDISFDLRKGEILGLAGLVGRRAEQMSPRPSSE